MTYPLILMDIDMPEIDGTRTTKLIRELETEHNCPRSYIIGLLDERYE